EPLTSFYPSPGITDERMDVFVARGLEPGPQRLDPTEEIEVAPMAWGDALEAIREGRIRDGKTIASLLFWERFGPGAG
ncbi:MAG TPA: NUDIX hydrolase, partial [Polyangiaceae bacterium LLY-WYZ-15_(1-7)]|nr:NUDIX hydrolase [Polyangiaceae bacterium LLY-WYZ-15_(1-7)]